MVCAKLACRSDNSKITQLVEVSGYRLQHYQPVDYVCTRPAVSLLVATLANVRAVTYLEDLVWVIY